MDKAQCYELDNPREGALCPCCKQDKLVVVEADEPWHDRYLICPGCDSTFCILED